jgi:hypothetical protein
MHMKRNAHKTHWYIEPADWASYLWIPSQRKWVSKADFEAMTPKPTIRYTAHARTRKQALRIAMKCPGEVIAECYSRHSAKKPQGKHRAKRSSGQVRMYELVRTK